MSGKVSSSEQAQFGFLVPVIFVAVLLLSALVLYLIFRHNRRTVRVEAPTASRTRAPLRHNIATQRREYIEYRVDNSDSRHEEPSESNEKKDERLQTILQSIICKNLNGLEGPSHVINEEEGHVTSMSIHEMNNDIVSSAVSDEVLSKSQTNGTSLNALNVYSTSTCSICCESYHFNDSIAWSKNNSCYHIYHEVCIINWLLKHDECPLCRRNYISAKNEESYEGCPIPNQRNINRFVWENVDNKEVLSGTIGSIFDKSFDYCAWDQNRMPLSYE